MDPNYAKAIIMGAGEKFSQGIKELLPSPNPDGKISQTLNAAKTAGSSAANTLKENIAATFKPSEFFETDFKGFELSSLKFFSDTGNSNTALIEKGSIFNSELMLVTSNSGKKAIAIPNTLLHTTSYGEFSTEILNIWEKYFDLDFDGLDTEDSENIIEYSIYEIFPAEFKLNGSYYELTKKGKLSLIAAIFDNDECDITTGETNPENSTNPVIPNQDNDKSKDSIPTETSN